MAGKSKHPKSPLAPARFPALQPLAGVRLGGYAAGLRYKGRSDVMVAELAPGSTIAGTFTTSQTSSAPVLWCRKHLPRGKARAIVVNAGNANVFTGRRGEQDVEDTARTLAGLIGCKPHEVFVAATGVIGQFMPIDHLVAALPKAHGRIKETGWKSAAEAIMTTDTFPKGAARTCRIGDAQVTVQGFAKGSGMIAPDMATMLAFMFTDAKLPPAVLQSVLRRATDRSFNSITVDGDTSTSDTLLLAATGQAKHPRITRAADPALKEFRAAVEAVATDLAHQVVRDGEGAQKFIEITVRGAQSAASARRVGLAIANSPLVKTAIAGGDANWGRIVMAVGKAGEKADRDKLSIWIGGHAVALNGGAVEDYDEAPVAAHVRGQNVRIELDIGVGRGKATVWTCDLTHGYIDINADYRS